MYTKMSEEDIKKYESSGSSLSLAEVMDGLNKPTPQNERRYRIGRILNEDTGLATVLTYVDARYVMDVLDQNCGTDKWSSEFLEIKGNLFCKISISSGVESVSKMDVGVPSNFEGEKGEVSDALKRCAVHFGIGRDLYNVGTIYADCKRTKSGQWTLPKDWTPYEDEADFFPSDQEIQNVRDNMELPCFTDEKREKFEEFLLSDTMTSKMWNRAVKSVERVVSEEMKGKE